MKREDLEVSGLFLFTAASLKGLGAMIGELGDDGSRDIGKWGPDELKFLLEAIRAFSKSLDKIIKELGGCPGANADEQGHVLDATAHALLRNSSAFDIVSPSALAPSPPPSPAKPRATKRRAEPSSPKKPAEKKKRSSTADSLTAAEVRELLKRQEEHQKQQEAQSRGDITQFFIVPGKRSSPKKSLEGPGAGQRRSKKKSGLQAPEVDSEEAAAAAAIASIAGSSHAVTAPPSGEEVAISAAEVSGGARTDTPSSFLTLQDDVVQGLLGLGQGQGFIAPSAVPTTSSHTAVATSGGLVYPDMTLNALNVNEEEEEEGLGLDYLQTS